MKKGLWIVFVLCAFVVNGMATSQPGLEVSDLSHKILSKPDEDGDLEISIKVNVRNTTETDIEAAIVVRGLDKEDYEVFEVPLSGKVKAKQSRVLTDSWYINEKRYKSIERWEVED